MGRFSLPPVARRFLAGFGIVVMVGSCAALFYFSRRYVDQRVVTGNAPPRIEILHRPGWMSDALADRIMHATQPTAARSALDHQVLVEVTDALRRNPWVKSIKQVKRVYEATPGDTIVIDCEYRFPVALVRWGNDYWLVDSDGYKLPEKYAPHELARVVFDAKGHTNLRVIQGVGSEPPKEAGRQWPGADLQAGIGLVKVLYGKTFADEIVKVDVANFGGKKDAREAQLVLVTRYATEIRWGRALDAKDYFAEVPAGQKLESMEKIYKQFGRIDAHVAWLDIRFDKIMYPRPEGDVRADVR